MSRPPLWMSPFKLRFSISSRDLRQKLGMSVLLITHNFGIVANFADRVLVMLDGRLVEQGPVKQILKSPQHPYTKALLDCIPRLGQKTKRLASIDRVALTTK